MAAVYAVYKIWHGDKIPIACCDSPTEAAIAIEEDMQKTDDCAQYEMVREDT